MSQRDSCVINKVLKGNSLLTPNIISFDYGALTKQDVPSIQCEMYVDKENMTDKTLALSKQSKRYMGKPENIQNALCQTILLIRNKKTNEARVIPFESCTLLNINPKKRKLMAESFNIQLNYKDGINTLSKAFGSKKSKRITEMQQRMDRTNQMIEADMTQEMGDITFDEIDNTAKGAEQAILNLLPPCNRNASNLCDVYPVEKLLSAEEQETLKSAAQHLMNNPPAESDQITNYFLYSQYQLLGPNPSISSLNLLVYGNAIVKFLNMSAAEVKLKNCANKICPFSNIIANKILNEFTIQSEQGRSRPLELKDKALSHVLVIMLLLNNYTVKLDLLTSSVKGFGITKLQWFVKLLGLSSLGGSSKQYVLKLPLPPLPVVKKARKISKK
ncbi:uncharacterized protein LOC106664025 [Cimex lectularius]|uniref:DNA-directed RNA polymerase I subunit RPA49 n=1 Tax=Cimex lectularius TaxID=79782 RepID=A0A8I6RK71_CIMLE|nr:uncharacterized protein LOC106664025 [Cimex lectularius]